MKKPETSSPDQVAACYAVSDIANGIAAVEELINRASVQALGQHQQILQQLAVRLFAAAAIVKTARPLC